MLDYRIGAYAALKGTLGRGPDQLLAAYRLNDDLGQLAYTVYFYPSLKYDEDQRDNAVNARRQQVQADHHREEAADENADDQDDTEGQRVGPVQQRDRGDQRE